MKKTDIDFSRGDKEIVFIKLKHDSKDISSSDNPRKTLLEQMSDEGLKFENVRILGIFKNEFSIEIQENSLIELNGEQIYPSID